MPRVVIADTSPLRYLILIGEAELLPALYTEVLIPEAVANELSQPATPEPVRNWIVSRPFWLRVVPLTARPDSVSLPDLDPGEHDAILLALQVRADLVLMDEREGVEEARRLGLSVTGTLGILERGAERELIELAPVSLACGKPISVSIRPCSTGCSLPIAGGRGSRCVQRAFLG